MGFTMVKLVHALALLTALMVDMTHGYTCGTSVMYDTDNYGPSISDDAVKASTPFAIGMYNAVLAFDASHCIKMCCEQRECALVVFNSVEAVCYMKAEGALQGGNYRTEAAAAGINIYLIDGRHGAPQPMELEPTKCLNKRGLGYGFKDPKDLYTLRAGLSWWYDWSPGNIDGGIFEASLNQGSEYVPMIWGEGDLTKSRLDKLGWVADSSNYLLGFNEPNYEHQSNLEAREAAELWGQVRALSTDYGMALVSPAVNFCYGACVEEDPYQWLDDFFDECATTEDPKCGMEYLAIHTYTCEVKYLNKHIHNYLKYGLPIWLTEFACAFQTEQPNEASQARLLADAATYLELHPDVFRYAWFTGRSSGTDGVTGSDLLTGTGDLTAVGKVFVEKYASLQRCIADDRPSPVHVSEPAYPAPSEEPPAHLTPEATSKPTERPSPSEGSEELDVDPSATMIKNVVITNVGGSGFYDQVKDMIDGTDLACDPGADSCITQEVCVSGNLAPFDEVSVSFKGPMNLYNIAWYEGTATTPLERTSFWTPDEENNIVFMNNRGGALGCGGVWSICGGNGQTFADAKGEWCEDGPAKFKGKLANDNEVNIMTSSRCASEEQCGFYRDVGMRGWTGGADGTKTIVFEIDMPHCSRDKCTYDRPAVWALNAQVYRTGQYGCNCRGMGGNGGCGEFDFLEAIIGSEHSDMLLTQVYDFKGAASPGTDKYFERPLSAKTAFAAIFRGGEESYLQIIQLDTWDFDAKSISTDLLDTFKATSLESHRIYDVDSREAPDGCPWTDSHGTIDSTTDDGSPEGIASGYEFIGCFADTEPIASQTMPIRTRRSLEYNQPKICASWCFTEQGSTLFGLQNGDLCWCGGMSNTDLGSPGEASNCDEKCPGNEDINCGGQKASSVYVLPVDHKYLGCYKDVRGDRDIRIVPKTASSLQTPSMCAAYCSGVEGATVFGVQNGDNCFCGKSYGKHGISTACNSPCNGDPDSICGGIRVNSVYSLTVPLDRAEDKPIEDMEGMKTGGYRGCFRDSPSNPLLTGIYMTDSERLTTESCYELCKGQRYAFFGVEWALMCFCGGSQQDKDRYLEDSQQLDQSDCYMECPGGGDDTCGGQNAIQIWEI